MSPYFESTGYLQGLVNLRFSIDDYCYVNSFLVITLSLSLSLRFSLSLSFVLLNGTWPQLGYSVSCMTDIDYSLIPIPVTVNMNYCRVIMSTFFDKIYYDFNNLYASKVLRSWVYKLRKAQKERLMSHF